MMRHSSRALDQRPRERRHRRRRAAHEQAALGADDPRRRDRRGDGDGDGGDRERHPATRSCATIEIAGPTTFYVMKVFSQTPLNPDQLPKWVRVRPDLTRRRGTRIASLPEIAYAAIWAQIAGAARVRRRRARSRRADLRRRRPVSRRSGRRARRGPLVHARPSSRAARRSWCSRRRTRGRLFGRVTRSRRGAASAAGRCEVIGLYQAPENIFAPPGQEIGAILPFRRSTSSTTSTRRTRCSSGEAAHGRDGRGGAGGGDDRAARDARGSGRPTRTTST